MSSRDKIAGWLGDALKIKVMAPPEKGGPTMRSSNCCRSDRPLATECSNAKRPRGYYHPRAAASRPRRFSAAFGRPSYVFSPRLPKNEAKVGIVCP